MIDSIFPSIFSLVVAFLLGAIVSFVICRYRKKKLKVDPLVFNESQMNEQLEKILRASLDKIVVAFKEEIPMAAMLLSQAREEKLRQLALEKLIQSSSEIKAFFKAMNTSVKK